MAKDKEFYKLSFEQENIPAELLGVIQSNASLKKSLKVDGGDLYIPHRLFSQAIAEEITSISERYIAEGGEINIISVVADKKGFRSETGSETSELSSFVKEHAARLPKQAAAEDSRSILPKVFTTLAGIATLGLGAFTVSKISEKGAESIIPDLDEMLEDYTVNFGDEKKALKEIKDSWSGKDKPSDTELKPLESSEGKNRGFELEVSR